MFSRKSEGGRDLVPTADPENSSVVHVAHKVMEESDPIFENRDIDDYARYIIGNDGEDSYEAEEDVAHSVTNVYRQRKNQQKKATLRKFAIAAILILLIVSVSLGIFFSLRKNQQQAYNANNSKNSNGTSETTGATTPLPNTPSPSASLPINNTKSPSIAPVIAIGTKAPSISPVASLQDGKVPFSMPQNFTPDTLEVPDVDLTNICGTSITNDMTKCEAECSKGTCCWSTNTCKSNFQCYLYKPCEILKQIASNSTNTTYNNVTDESSSYGGCAAESPGSPTLECFPMFLPCRKNKDCEHQMLNLGAFVNCTDTCSEATYTIVSDNAIYGINISDAIQGIDNVLNNMMDGNSSLSYGPIEIFNETDAFTSLTDNNNNSSFNSFVDTVSNVLDMVSNLTDHINISYYGDIYNSSDIFTQDFDNSSNNSSTDNGFIDTVINVLNTVSDFTSNNNSASLTDDYYGYYVPGNSSANLDNTTSLLVWNRITFDDFQSGWGNFKDGGDDAKLVHIPMSDGDETNMVARLRDNSKESVMRLKEAKDTTQYDALRVSFWLETEKVDHGDALLLEYSSDGGSNWEIVKEWIFGEDADLNDNGIVYQLNTTFYSADYVFSEDSFIRFRSDASSDSDHFYMDNVEFEGAKSMQ